MQNQKHNKRTFSVTWKFWNFHWIEESIGLWWENLEPIQAKFIVRISRVVNGWIGKVEI